PVTSCRSQRRGEPPHRLVLGHGEISRQQVLWSHSCVQLCHPCDEGRDSGMWLWSRPQAAWWLALRARDEDNGDVNVRNAAYETGTRAVDDATPTPKGESMADESGVMLPGSREEMRFLRRNSNWVNMIIAILACLAVVVGILFIAPQPEVDSERVVDYQGIAEQSEGNADFDLI